MKSASPETTQPTPPALGSPASAGRHAGTARAGSGEVPAPQLTKSAGHIIVDSLVAHGVKRTYVVPGESFLDLLDGLHDSSIDTIVCRHEGGATYMAEADGKMKQTPGVAMVTRGPGAANAHVGLHTAWQDSTPLVLFVGLIPFAHRDREAFQEFDIKAWFDTGAKRVMVLDHAERASEIVAEAMFSAMNGRPGPVVVGLPEDVIREHINPELHPVIPVATGGMTTVDSAAVAEALMKSSKPLFVTGGNDWTQAAADQLTQWLERHHIPVAAEWRTQGTVPFDSPSYVGPIGYGRPRPTYDLLEETDLLMLAKLRNMGEACTAANRFIVHESVAQEFAQKFAAKMKDVA
ncbi:aldehyde dehydrogenase family protein [Pseudarthrobacter cellobiosi]|uniref:aldehyde dehydrogenase family protein n=1 Tax=Pseudarthrobacter cellobiosi TaxID=2953654 RepID=UPI0035AC12A3